MVIKAGRSMEKEVKMFDKERAHFDLLIKINDYGNKLSKFIMDYPMIIGIPDATSLYASELAKYLLN
ncbi:MAG: hypothetical protein AABX88_00100 [Nanoarchaeota archaeon]